MNDFPSDFLSIGVPSIKRINGFAYLLQTVQSLIDESTTLQQLRSTVIVLLADVDETYNLEVEHALQQKFNRSILIGFLQVVRISPEFYPELTNLKHTFQDSASRVRWRAKQVADYAFLFMFARNQSQYYLQLEDDVICAHNYLKDIKYFISLQKHGSWSVLEFSELGFIGKLFKSDDLPKLAQFMMTFYAEQPVDWLIGYFRLVMTQQSVILRRPTLFQHIGKVSSYDTSKDNNLKDRFFAGGSKKWASHDPPATILSTMEHYGTYFAQLAYASGSGYFWAQNPKMGDSISIVFDQPQNVTRLVVETGNSEHPTDTLHAGTIEASSTLIKIAETTGRAVCAEPRLICHFKDGRCDVTEVTTKVKGFVRCVTITVTGNQEGWAVFDQIAVFVWQANEDAELSDV